MRRAAPLVVAAILLVGCVGTDTQTAGPTSTVGSPPVSSAGEPSPPATEPTLRRLCVLDPTGGREHIRDRFFVGAHHLLHELADELQQAGERAAAARLLAAKQHLEAGLRATAAPQDLAERVRRLIAATRTGLRAVGRPAGGCP